MVPLRGGDQCMWEAIYEFIEPWGESFDLTILQVAVRTVVVYLGAIFLVRVGNKRFMGNNTAFDLLLGIMLGSVLSRGITGQVPLLSAIVSGAILIGIHWVVGGIAIRIERFGPWVKGRSRTLIKNGVVDEEAMRKSHIGEYDLKEALRIAGHTEDVRNVALGSLERNGSISIVPRKRPPRILEVKVEEGVKTVRIELTE